MTTRETKTLSFTPQQASFVEKCVTSGRYQSASEVVRAGLRLLADEEATRVAAIKKVQEMITHGADQLDRGEIVDGMEVLDTLDTKLEKLRNQA